MTLHNRIASFLLLVSFGTFTACGGGAAPPPPGSSGPAVRSAQPTPAANPAEDPQNLFNTVCYVCHGTTGHGDGPGAAALEPKPRSFADAKWQESVTDAQIEKAIVFGGAAVGKSAMMPGHPQFKGKDAVLKGLVAIVRGFKGK
ncbi:MAG: hypothetical protein JNK15_14280 [Planctomycetes bacterium]|nr:hypothetical protein [Planctomycetota bacterium]